MMSARTASRLTATATRNANTVRALRRQQARFQSTTSSTSNNATAGSSSHFGAGVAGGVAGAVLFYGIYSFTPAGRTASSINKAAREAEKKYREAAKKLQENTPTSDQAVDSIKQYAYSYVGWVPGGKAYVDTAFKDWETVRKNHREEADKLVGDAYKQFQDVSKSGLSLETASQAVEVLADLSKKVANLTGDALSDIVDNHPQFKEKLGGNVDKLKKMGDEYGPEAKKQVDETWRQVKDVLAGGFGVSNLDEARKLVEEKVQQVQKLGDEAWKKGLEEAKPYLDKSPRVKELVEKNADALKQGNVTDLFSKARSAVESGDVKGLEGFVKQAIEKVGSGSGGGSGSKLSGQWGDLGKYLKKIPQGQEDILQKLQQLGQIAEKHSDEGEKLFTETIEEIKKVVEEKSRKAQELLDSAKEEAK